MNNITSLLTHTESSSKSRRFAFRVSAGTVCIHIWLFFNQISKHYVIDDATFPYAASGILKTVTPYFYNGEFRPNDLGLWHPPLYVYSLAFNMMVFGESPASVRFFGLLAIATTSYICFKTLGLLFPNNNLEVFSVFLLLFLLNPLVIAGALTPDIDGTLGMVATALVFYLSLNLIKKDFSRHQVVLAIFTLIFCWYTKFTITILLSPILFLAALIAPTNRIRKMILVVASTVFGFCFFFLTYTIFCRLLNMPSSFLFDYFKSGLKRTSSGNSRISSLFERLSLSGQLFYWINPFYIALTFLTCVFLCWAVFKKNSVNWSLILLALSGPFIVVAYAAITSFPFTFPKYWSIALIPFALASSSMGFICLKKLVGFTENLSAVLTRPFFSFLLIVIGAFYFLQHVRLTNRILDNNRIGFDLIWSGVFIFMPLLVVATLMIYWNSRKNSSKTNRLREFPSIIFVSVSFMTIATSALVSNIHNSAPFSTQYYFSERGLDTVLKYLRNNISSSSTLICAKDIGIQSGHKFYEDSFLLSLKPNELTNSLELNTAEYFVSRNKWDYSPSVYPEQFDIFSNFYTPIDNQPSADFVIWKRNP